MYLMGVKGDCSYLVDMKSEEGYQFSVYGEAIKKVTANSVFVSNINLIEVDVLSIIGEAVSRYSEIYFNGYVAVVGRSLLDVFASVRDRVKKASPIVFNINHSEGVQQIILALQRGTATKEFLNTIFGQLDWVKLS